MEDPLDQHPWGFQEQQPAESRMVSSKPAEWKCEQCYYERSGKSTRNEGEMQLHEGRDENVIGNEPSTSKPKTGSRFGSTLFRGGLSEEGCGSSLGSTSDRRGCGVGFQPGATEHQRRSLQVLGCLSASGKISAGIARVMLRHHDGASATVTGSPRNFGSSSPKISVGLSSGQPLCSMNTPQRCNKKADLGTVERGR